ncbi:MAG: DNA-3-methyladenine glycosylase family protein [Desertimonas sp.]
MRLMAPAVRVDPDLGHRLGWYRQGRGDPTTRITATSFVRAMWTPDGPATVAATWADGSWRRQGWGPGATWAAAALDRMAGAFFVDSPAPTPCHPLVSAAMHRHRRLWAGASGDLYHELLPAILQQRITSRDAKMQWRRLCHALGDAAPGPDPTLRLPPRPEMLAGQPAWWFHPLGIEAKRARALLAVAGVADRLWSWAAEPPAAVADRLATIAGVGPWTIGTVLGPACGDDDAVAVGDYHIPNMVAWNLMGEARADDERMLALLEPYRGQRGRVIRLLGLVGEGAPAFGPRQRILPMHRW